MFKNELKITILKGEEAKNWQFDEQFNNGKIQRPSYIVDGIIPNFVIRVIATT